MVKVGDIVHAEYNNGEVIDGEVITVKAFGDRTLVTVKAEQGYRSIYLDKCVTFDVMEAAN